MGGPSEAIAAFSLQNGKFLYYLQRHSMIWWVSRSGYITNGPRRSH